MPDAWIAQLRDCATKVHGQQILQLINQIPSFHCSFS